MPTNDLRIAESDWDALRRFCAPSLRKGSAPEIGAIALLGVNRAAGREQLLVARMVWPEEGDLKVADWGRLVLDSRYIRRALLAVRAEGLAGLATFHTHPGADERVAFSWNVDDVEDPKLAANLQDLEPGIAFASVVLGRNSQQARRWEHPNRPVSLDQLVVVGETLRILPLDGGPEPAPPPPSAAFDRALALTGGGALAQLARMTVAVVGASGTGSLVCELLARAGCRHILLIDDDVVKVVNLNRIAYATASDAERGEKKVRVMARGIQGLGLECEVEPIDGTILNRKVLARLMEADAIIGCVDKAYPRKLMAQVAYRYLIPYLDVGSEIGGDDRGIVSLDARVTYVAPGRPCTLCTGLVTPRQIAFETLAAGERDRVVALGYSDDLLLAQPAVMDLNMRAASLGILVLRHLLQPFLWRPLPSSITENLVTYTMRPIKEGRAATPDCPVCGTRARLGSGDRGPVLGLDPDTFAAILGTGRDAEE